MPKKRVVKTYSIDELGPEAREAAIARRRENAFTHADADTLTDDFQEQLEEKGLQDPKANWSLGYCQGDGVCFKGTVDVAKVVQQNKLSQFKPLVAAEKLNLISAKVHHDDSRYCHWNSMTVELELGGDVPDLLPKDLHEEWSEWWHEHRRIMSRWGHEKWAVNERNMAPIRDWERRLEAWRKSGGTSRDWSPRRSSQFRNPGEKPMPGTEPEPPQPVFPMPEHLQAALAGLDQKWKAIEALMTPFEEWLEQWVKDVSKELEKLGYEEIEYRRSDEAIAERFRNRDAQFLEDGEEFKS